MPIGHESIREYFSADFGDLYEVTYTPANSEPVDTHVFIEKRTAESEDGSVSIPFYQIIVGKDHVVSPGGGDIVVCATGTMSGTYYAQDVLNEDNDTSKMRFEKG